MNKAYEKYGTGDVFCKIPDEKFLELKRDIERAMKYLADLQKVYNNQTGQNHTMPLYLATPKHLMDY